MSPRPAVWRTGRRPAGDERFDGWAGTTRRKRADGGGCLSALRERGGEGGERRDVEGEEWQGQTVWKAQLRLRAQHAPPHCCRHIRRATCARCRCRRPGRQLSDRRLSAAVSCQLSAAGAGPVTTAATRLHLVGSVHRKRRAAPAGRPSLHTSVTSGPCPPRARVGRSARRAATRGERPPAPPQIASGWLAIATGNGGRVWDATVPGRRRLEPGVSS